MKILNRNYVKTLERSVLQYNRHHQHRCTKILKTSNIEELRRGLVKTLRGLSIAVSDDRLSAELLIPLYSTSGQLCTTHLLHPHHHYQSLDFILTKNIFILLIIITITIVLFHQSISNLESDLSYNILVAMDFTFTREFTVSSLYFSCLLCMFRRARVPLVWCYQGIGPSRLLA